MSDKIRKVVCGNVPGYVKNWLGSWRSIEFFRIGPGAFLMTGDKRSILVSADTTDQARRAVRAFVSVVDQTYDRRRVHWVYT